MDSWQRLRWREHWGSKASGASMNRSHAARNEAASTNPQLASWLPWLHGSKRGFLSLSPLLGGNGLLFKTER